MTDLALTGESTMGEILSAYPTAKTVLFAKFHIGGCTSCSYEDGQTLAEVKAQHEVTASVDEIVRVIHESGALEQHMRIDCESLQARIASGGVRVLDARSKAEHEWSRLPGAELITPELTFEALDEWPKETAIVVYSNNGDRSMQKAAHFACYGMTDVRSLDGGLKAWMAAGAPLEESDAAKAAQG